MPGCCAPHCTNNLEKGFRLFVFPTNPERRSRWHLNCRRDNWEPSKYARLCEDHFDDNQWERSRADGKRKLRQDAIPTLFYYNKPKALLPVPVPVRVPVAVNPRPSPSPPLPLPRILRSSTKRKQIMLVREAGEPRSPTIDGTPLEFVERHPSDGCVAYDVPNDKLKKIIAEQDVQLAACRRKVYACRRDRYAETRRNQGLKSIFNDDQLEAVTMAMAVVRKVDNWSDDTVAIALGLLFSCGRRGYEQLRSLRLPYPSLTTLREHLLRSLDCQPGILRDVFDLLRHKVRRGMVGDRERQCVLLVDETRLTPINDYEGGGGGGVGVDRFVGGQTLTGNVGTALSTRAIVFMLGGIATRWKQTVAYHFAGDSVMDDDDDDDDDHDGSALKEVVLEIVALADDVGLNVDAIITDASPSYMRMRKSFAIIGSEGGGDGDGDGDAKDLKTINGRCPAANRTIEFLADPVHVFKSIWSSLHSRSLKISNALKVKYNLPGNTICAKHIEDICDVETRKESKLSRELTPRLLLDDAYFDKMEVRRERRVIDTGPSGYEMKFDGRKTCLVDDPESLTTAWFVEVVNRWFDVMTNRSVGSAALRRYDSDSCDAPSAFLAGAIEVFDDLSVADSGGDGDGTPDTWKAVQATAISTTASVLRLKDRLLVERKFERLPTSAFARDCPENLFAVLRLKRPTMTPLEFKGKLKIVTVAQYLKCVERSWECRQEQDEDEDESFLREFLGQISPPKMSRTTEPGFVLKGRFGSTERSRKPSDVVADRKVLRDIARYVASNVQKLDKTCGNCLPAIFLQRPTADDDDSQGREEHRMRDVNQRTFALFVKMERLFRRHERQLLVSDGCKRFFLEILNADDAIQSLRFPRCHSIKASLMKRFTVFRLKILGVKSTRKASRKVGGGGSNCNVSDGNAK